MNKEEAIRFAGLMEEYLHIPAFVCEMIQDQLENNNYKEVVEYVIKRRNEIENKDDNEYPIEEELEEAYKTINQLTNNWNELEEWLKEYMRKNENWYTNELSTYDKQYYGDTYYTTNAVLMTILDKMKEIKEGKE